MNVSGGFFFPPPEISKNYIEYVSAANIVTSFDVPRPVIEGYIAFEGIWLGFVIVFGILGNCFSLLVFLLTPIRRSPTTIYLAALAASDTTFLWALSLRWIERFGTVSLYSSFNIVCQIVIYTINTSAAMSTWLVVLFTAERFLVVLYPLHHLAHSSKKRARRLVLGLLPCPLLWYAGTFVVCGIEELTRRSQRKGTPQGGTYNDMSSLVDTIVRLQNAAAGLYGNDTYLPTSYVAIRSVKECLASDDDQLVTTIFHFADTIVVLLIPLVAIVSLNIRIGRELLRASMTAANMTGGVKQLNHSEISETNKSTQCTQNQGSILKRTTQKWSRQLQSGKNKKRKPTESNQFKRNIFTDENHNVTSGNIISAHYKNVKNNFKNPNYSTDNIYNDGMDSVNNTNHVKNTNNNDNNSINNGTRNLQKTSRPRLLTFESSDFSGACGCKECRRNSFRTAGWMDKILRNGKDDAISCSSSRRNTLNVDVVSKETSSVCTSINEGEEINFDSKYNNNNRSNAINYRNSPNAHGHVVGHSMDGQFSQGDNFRNHYVADQLQNLVKTDVVINNHGEETLESNFETVMEPPIVTDINPEYNRLNTNLESKSPLETENLVPNKQTNISDDGILDIAENDTLPNTWKKSNPTELTLIPVVRIRRVSSCSMLPTTISDSPSKITVSKTSSLNPQFQSAPKILRFKEQLSFRNSRAHSSKRRFSKRCRTLLRQQRLTDKLTEGGSLTNSVTGTPVTPERPGILKRSMSSSLRHLKKIDVECSGLSSNNTVNGIKLSEMSIHNATVLVDGIRSDHNDFCDNSNIHTPHTGNKNKRPSIVIQSTSPTSPNGKVLNKYSLAEEKSEAHEMEPHEFVSLTQPGLHLDQNLHGNTSPRLTEPNEGQLISDLAATSTVPRIDNNNNQNQKNISAVRESANNPRKRTHPQVSRGRQSWFSRPSGIFSGPTSPSRIGSVKPCSRAARDLKTTRFLVLISSVFVTLNFPHNLLSLIEMTSKTISQRYHTGSAAAYLVLRISTALYYLNYAINFALFNACSRNFRTCARGLIELAFKRIRGIIWPLTVASNKQMREGRPLKETRSRSAYYYNYLRGKTKTRRIRLDRKERPQLARVQTTEN